MTKSILKIKDQHDAGRDITFYQTDKDKPMIVGVGRLQGRRTHIQISVRDVMELTKFLCGILDIS